MLGVWVICPGLRHAEDLLGFQFRASGFRGLDLTGLEVLQSHVGCIINHRQTHPGYM